MSDIEFIDGLIIKAPNPKAPDFVKASVSINVANLKKWLDAQTEEWVNAQTKESRNGKWYTAKDDWKPSGGEKQKTQAAQPDRGGFTDDDIPFAPHGKRAHWIA